MGAAGLQKDMGRAQSAPTRTQSMATMATLIGREACALFLPDIEAAV